MSYDTRIYDYAPFRAELSRNGGRYTVRISFISEDGKEAVLEEKELYDEDSAGDWMLGSLEELIYSLDRIRLKAEGVA